MTETLSNLVELRPTNAMDPSVAGTCHATQMWNENEKQDALPRQPQISLVRLSQSTVQVFPSADDTANLQDSGQDMPNCRLDPTENEPSRDSKLKHVSCDFRGWRKVIRNFTPS